MKMEILPIDALLPEILATLERVPTLVLQASPGSGKTTRVPPALLAGSFLAPQQRIDVLVPRRLAAKLAAFRVAEQLGETVGRTVGYQFRFENVTSSETRIRFLTEGLLLRQLIRDPTLAATGVVILDEFHERSLHSDVALAYLKTLQQTQRPELRLIAMSATLEGETIARYLGGAPVIKREIAPHPVEIHYLPGSATEYLEIQVLRAVRQALAQPAPGDILVFLPGMSEIRRAEERLKRDGAGEWVVLPLHGELPPAEQAKVFAKYPQPKVILATNVAETSVTIDGVRTVIDSGLHRQASYSWWNGIPALKTRPISKAAAIQRAGRAGRQGPGRCFRLYSTADFQGRPDFERPEVQRADLSQILLEIKSLGRRLSDFPWFEAPASGALQSGLETLDRLGALAGTGLDAPLSAVGQRMAEFPLHPRLSRMLLEAEQRGVLDRACRLAALLSEQALEGLDVLEACATLRGAESVQRLQRQLRQFFPASAKRAGTPLTSQAQEEALALCLLQGFPDRVAKQRKSAPRTQERGRAREGRERELVFCDGGSGTVEASAVVAAHEYFIVLGVQELQAHRESQGRVRVRQLCPIAEEWLLAGSEHLLKEEDALLWDEAARRVWRQQRLCYGQLVLSESKTPPPDSAATSRFLLQQALGLSLDAAAQTWSLHALLEALRHLTDPQAITEQFARLQLFARHHPQLSFPAFEGEGLKQWVVVMFEGLNRLGAAELAALPDRLLALIPASAQGEWQRACPSQVSLAGGRRVKVHYSLEKGPWIASRLQDFFGMRELPKILNGRVGLTAQLLAPNQRPVQVTDDLGSFWKNAYPALRKELGRRYPRHKWPEDPLNISWLK